MNVVWLKRDLRSTDHGPLYEASLRGDLMVIYVVEDEVVAHLPEQRRHGRVCRVSKHVARVVGPVISYGSCRV